MRFPHPLIPLAFMVALFHTSSTGLKNSTQPSNIIGDIKDFLLREADKQTNATRPDLNTHRTGGALAPSHNIVDQIINLFNCGSFPLSPNSHLKYLLNHSTNNLQAFQTCNRYFQTTKKNESLLVQCKDDKWIFNEIGCEKTTCPHLTAPPGGYISTNHNTYNTTVYFWCSPGFSINGTDKLFCEESGLWNLPPPTCDVLYCHPLPSPRHGSVSSQVEEAVNKTVEFKCNGEYSLFGDAVLRCQDDGRWNATAPVCKKLCTVPKLRRRYLESVHLVPSFRYLPIGSQLQPGQRVIFSCKLGYTVLVSGFSTCIGGTLRPPIRCRKGCFPVEITNGKYALSKDSSTIEYSCLDGYQLLGQQKLSCTPNSTWDSEAPICTQLCTLPDREEVLSFRRKETYEIIPFGTQIINGTQVKFVCRGKGLQYLTVTTCIKGSLRPPPCSARLVSGNLQLYANNEWYPICESYGGPGNMDICGYFGYQKNLRPNRPSCPKCYRLSSSIQVSSGYYERSERCAFCSKIK